jgi:membrane-bound lytic murein transglycosylase D
LPPGVARPEPNAEARHRIAGGPTDDEKTSSPLDAELQVLREAERVLFPKPLPGLRSGWSWDVENSSSEVPGSLILPPESVVLDGTKRNEPVGKWLSELVLPNIPTHLESNVVTYLQFYRSNPQGKALLRTWARKSGRYAKLITAEFSKAGLPTDLLWQSMIESGHNPAAKSSAGAVGLWQFLPDTARAYGLVVDRWVDERLDPQRSTEASAKLLADLHRRFGNWELALAAYNMGYAGLGRAIRKYNTNDYWQLCRYESGLPWETTLYVPKIEALAIAMSNRSVFGIADVEPEAVVPADIVSVGPGLPISAIAKAAGVAESEIGSLNPQFLAGRTPPVAPGQNQAVSYAVRVPAGSGSIVARRLSSFTAPDVTLESYVIKQGDTLESIARGANLAAADLRSINQVGASELLSAGDVLLLPRRDKPLDVDIAEDERVVVVARESKVQAGMRRVFYRVVPGDTLSSIAKAFQVRRSDLLEWNRIDTSARLQAKMALAIYVPERQVLSGVRYASEADVRILVAGSQPFAEYFEGLRGNERIVIQARAGDTLANLATKYNINAATLERVNRRPRNSRYAEGEEIVLYAPRGKIAKPTRSAREALREPRERVNPTEPNSTKAPKPPESAAEKLPDSG